MKLFQDDLDSANSKKKPRQVTVKFNLSSDFSGKVVENPWSDNNPIINSYESSKDKYSFISNFAHEKTDCNNKPNVQLPTRPNNQWELPVGEFQLPQSKLDIEIVPDQKGQELSKQFQKFQRKISNHIRDIVKNLHYLQNLHNIREISNLIELEWRAVGLVVDRLFFYCYIFIIVFSMASYFPRDGESKFDVDNPNLP